MRTIRTAKNRARFLEAVVEAGGNVRKACQMVHLSRNALYQWRDEDPEFAAAWEAALQRGADVLEDEARRRAVEGVPEPVLYRGQVIGAVRKYSDMLLIFLLKGAKPEKYRDGDLDRRLAELERLAARRLRELEKLIEQRQQEDER